MGLSKPNWRAWLCLLLQSRSAQCLSPDRTPQFSSR